jgi:hypothetical protein
MGTWSREEVNNMGIILINLSGHPAPRGAEERFIRIISVPVPNVDIGNVAAIKAEAQDLLKKVLEDTDAADALSRGEAAVILPGATALAAAVLAVLEGLSGVFPKLFWAVRTEQGFVLSEGLSLDALRREGRNLRGGPKGYPP